MPTALLYLYSPDVTLRIKNHRFGKYTIVIIEVLAHPTTDNNHRGRCVGMPMNGHYCPRFYGIEHSLRKVILAIAQVTVLPEPRVCLGLGRESIEKLIV